MLSATVKRRPTPDSWSEEGIITMRGSVDNVARIDGQRPEVGIHPAADDESLGRDYYITNKILRETGYTANCPKCDAIRRGTKRPPQHVGACKRRIREHLEQSEEGRNFIEAGERRRTQTPVGIPVGMPAGIPTEDVEAPGQEPQEMEEASEHGGEDPRADESDTETRDIEDV